MKVKYQMILGVIRFALFFTFIIVSIILAIFALLKSDDVHINILAMLAILIGVLSLGLDGLLNKISTLSSDDK